MIGNLPSAAVQNGNPAVALFSCRHNKLEPRNWQDAWSYKLSGQYAPNSKLDLRTGYSFDTVGAGAGTNMKLRRLGP